MKTILLALILCLFATQLHAQSTAQPIQLGSLSTTGCAGTITPCFVPYSVANPMPTSNATGGSVPLGSASQTLYYATTGTTVTPTSVISINSSNVSYVGSLPTLSACGTTPALDANATNNSGTITIGTGVPTGCVLTFNPAYTSFNHCTITDHSTSVLVSYSYTTSALTLAGSSLAGIVVDYRCDGK